MSKAIYTFECRFQSEVSAFIHCLGEMGGRLLSVGGCWLDTVDTCYVVTYQHTKEIDFPVMN